MLDFTHAPDARSWLGSANAADTDFPIQNLPFGRFRRAGTNEPMRIGVAIGDQVLDLAALGHLDPQIAVLLGPLAQGDLNGFMAHGRAARIALRHALFAGLSAEPSGTASLWHAKAASLLVPQDEAETALPCRIGDYTDFYTGIHHATTVGKLFRPDNPLLPNYKWVPIGYHGRSSSIGVSGQRFARPWGQTKGEGDVPVFAPSRRVDYELELGFFVGPPNAPGMPLDMAQAEASLFGATLLNDWSARDVQAWEYQPLGPFLAKNFGTTVSPWIVTAEALEPFRIPFTRPEGDPQPLPYLDSAANRAGGAYAIELEVWIQTNAMRERGAGHVLLSRSSFRHAYWTLAQLITHHASNGCNLQSGDLLGTGTLSGPAPEEAGSLLELTEGGRKSVTLANGEQRSFLEDGDSIELRAKANAPQVRRIGFGACEGRVLAARA